jgi:preprotein translocase subunit SecB
VKSVDTNKNVVDVTCIASFSFDYRLPIESIPEYFYPNSLAIVFPYVRAFVSTLSLQANVHPIILPTVNLMGLTEQLKKNTIVKE